MAIKTYVLLEHTKPTAEVYLRVNANERVRMDKKPVDHAYLQLAFSNAEGINKVLRLKLNSNSIYQDEQMKAGILANERFTQAEKDAVKFVNGVCLSRVKVVQDYLDATPQNEKVWKSGAMCPDIIQPLFKEYDEKVEIQSENRMFHKRLKAANKIASCNLEQAKELMIRLNGKFFKTPDSLDECQNGLVDFLDNANELALDDIIRDEVTNQEEISLIVAKAIGANIIDFNTVINNVVKHTSDERIIPLKEIPSSYPSEERERMFVEHLTTKEGALILEDIRNELSKRDEQSVDASGDNENVGGGSSNNTDDNDKRHKNLKRRVGGIKGGNGKKK